MASDQKNKTARSRSAGRTTSKQSLTQPTLLERGFLGIYPPFCRINRELFELATARKLARQLNTSAFIGTDRGLLRSILGPSNHV